MNIKAIRLQNFRGFRDARIELKELTVLLGPNSAGKSAFGHALAAMAHAHRIYAPGPQATLTPPVGEAHTWPIDLGVTTDLRTRGATGPVLIGLETSEGMLELGFGGLEPPDSPALFFSHVVHPSSDQSVSIATPGHTVVPAQTAAVNPSHAQSGIVPVEGAIHEKDMAIKLVRINKQQWREGETAATVTLAGLTVQAVTHSSGTARALDSAAIKHLDTFLNNITYLRATRERPSRTYPYGLGEQQPIGYSGEWAPSILFKQGLDQVSYPAPPQYPDDPGKIDYEWRVVQEPLVDAVGAWLSRLNLAGTVEAVPPSSPDFRVELRVTLKGQSSRNITEIGFGISQVVPVLVAGLLQPKDSLFIVDLPEAHLHPRPQGAIADFFCSLALSGRFSLVETHSEMFFHRLRLRAAMDPGLMDKIAVYFIDPAKDGFSSVPREVGLRFEDELRWPEGFLQEAYETEMHINAVRQAGESRP